MSKLKPTYEGGKIKRKLPADHPVSLESKLREDWPTLSDKQRIERIAELLFNSLNLIEGLYHE